MKLFPLIAGAGLLYLLSTRAGVSTAPAPSNYVPDIKPTGQALIPLPAQGVQNPSGAQYVMASQLDRFNQRNEYIAWQDAYQAWRVKIINPIEKAIAGLQNNTLRYNDGSIRPETLQKIQGLQAYESSLMREWLRLNPKPVM